jgi:hypothetical protein
LVTRTMYWLSYVNWCFDCKINVVKSDGIQPSLPPPPPPPPPPRLFSAMT